MPAKLLLENEYHSREISLDRPERTFVWREVGSGKEGEPDWDSCVVDHVRITHLNKPPERRIVRVDVVYKDGKLPRAFELMVGDDENPMPLYRDGMFIHLMRE